MRGVILLTGMVLFTASVCTRGAELVWTGSADGKWGSGLNWTNAAGSAESFASGDSVRFDDGASVRMIRAC